MMPLHPHQSSYYKLDIRKFFQATNPDRPLFADNQEEDAKFYIDFSSVRGGQVIEDLKTTITFFSPNIPTCQLFTGHIGCGKSTELQKLTVELQQEGFHVVYLNSLKDLEIRDVDISDILLAITHRVIESLESVGIKLEQNYFMRLFKDMKNILFTPVDFDVKFSFLIAEITTKAQASPDVRKRLRNYLEPQTSTIIENLNSAILNPGIEQLKKKGNKGLVVIVDSLEKIDNVPKYFKRLQPEYLFIDRGSQLSSLDCHLVYTMPLSLRFSNEYGSLTQQFQDPKVLPMVGIRSRNGKISKGALVKLRNMILARAFPHLSYEYRLGRVTEIFDSIRTLDYLCLISGGHIRNLLRLLNTSIHKEKRFPITYMSLESVIIDHLNERLLAILPNELDLLREIRKTKKVTKGDEYQALIRSMYVYEYRDSVGPWFDINPILCKAREFQ